MREEIPRAHIPSKNQNMTPFPPIPVSYILYPGFLPLNRLTLRVRQILSFFFFSELLTRGAQNLTRDMTSKAFVCATRPTFLCCASPKNNHCSRTMILLSDSSKFQELSRKQHYQKRLFGRKNTGPVSGCLRNMCAVSLVFLRSRLRAHLVENAQGSNLFEPFPHDRSGDLHVLLEKRR